LTPPHLGQVEIQVTTRGKKVEIEMKSQSDLAKVTLESQLSDLKQSLHGQDLQLTKVEVQVDRDVARTFTGNSFAALANGNQTFQGSHGFHGQQQSQAGRQWAQASTTSTTGRITGQPEGMVRTRSTASGNGRVDIRI
jgi:flagellar hook-length control protein FliK